MNIPSPILLMGNSALTAKEIHHAKTRYSNCFWITLSGVENSIDEIRRESCSTLFTNDTKIIVIKDLINKKQFKDFICELVKSSSDTLKFVIWDSTEEINIDPKTKSIGKLWQDFLDSFKSNVGHKIINHGYDFTDKEDNDCLSFIRSEYSRQNKSITEDAAVEMLSMVGRNKAILRSEANKLSLAVQSKEINIIDVENHCFNVKQEPILYKLNNLIDSSTFTDILYVIEQYMQNGTHPLVISEILGKKAKWQMIACQLYAKDESLYSVRCGLMGIGNVPHNVHKLDREKYKDKSALIDYLVETNKYQRYLFNSQDEKSEKSDKIPMDFMAQQVADRIYRKFVLPNRSKMSMDEIKQKMVEKSIRVYLNVVNAMKEMRYNTTTMPEIYNMVRELCDCRL